MFLLCCGASSERDFHLRVLDVGFVPVRGADSPDGQAVHARLVVVPIHGDHSHPQRLLRRVEEADRDA
jgi:hypothetical protein